MHHPQVLKTVLRLTCCNPQRLGRRSQWRRRSWQRCSGAAALLRALCRCSQWRISLAGLCTAHRQSALSNPPPSAPRSVHRYRNTPCIDAFDHFCWQAEEAAGRWQQALRPTSSRCGARQASGKPQAVVAAAHAVAAGLGRCRCTCRPGAAQASPARCAVSGFPSRGLR